MTFEQFQLEHQKRTEGKETFQPFLYAMGIAGEAGEVVDQVKKHIRENHGDPRLPLSAERKGKITLELGDLFFYIVRFCQVENIDLEGQVFEGAIKKLDRLIEDGKTWG